MHTRSRRLQTLLLNSAMPHGSSQPCFCSRPGASSKTGYPRQGYSSRPSVPFLRGSFARFCFFFLVLQNVAYFLSCIKLGFSEHAAVGLGPQWAPSTIGKISRAGCLLGRSGPRGRYERKYPASFLLLALPKDLTSLESRAILLNSSFNFPRHRRIRQSARTQVWIKDGFGVGGRRERKQEDRVLRSTAPVAIVLAWRPVVRFLQGSLQTWFRAMASAPSQLAPSLNKAPTTPLHEMLKSFSKGTAVEVVTECAGSAAAFWCTCASSVLLQKSLGVSCASKTCKLFGITTVFVASNAAAVAAATVRCAFQLCGVTTPRDNLSFANIGRAAVDKLGLDALANRKNEVSAAVLPSSIKSGTGGLKDWSDSLMKVGLKEGILGSAIFWLLGGRFFRLSPSCLLAPGAFHQSRLSLRAGIDYASVEERRFIKKLGETFGCHTCGKRRNVEEWIADHQPPKRVVVMFSQTWIGHFYGMLSRAVGGTRYLPQRFYPQCRGCSMKQATVVRKPKPSRKDLVVNYWSVRPYHFTGGVLHLLRFLAGW
ncbi:hypothetical protein TGME49_278170 [Toxoplasma gondii ME49]|uniref:Transmembrane protein n=1 Tax=Toxoplasma gondii (strain ATCC 50611 / Me49) TaxID=508771 RepID=S8EPW1_TOXGM|nr:hypothetical protein TGME49_278170 [Toxoplasma gondii ME49]EPT25346.1 hypothetical protein TGME49_278170 [Toxoplasma gondii ME49]|eukprot:XP_002370520.2 hypothetical protein TGME49_278170 [Toxoplasma gondii ME49]